MFLRFFFILTKRYHRIVNKNALNYEQNIKISTLAPRVLIIYIHLNAADSVRVGGLSGPGALSPGLQLA